MTAGDPQPLILRPSKRIWLLFIELFVTSICVYEFWVWLPGGAVKWLLILLFALGGLLSAADNLPGARYLELGPGGFVICVLFRKGPPVPWAAVSSFRVARARLGRKATVVFDLAGAGQALPETYGMTPQDLADLMNQWQANCARK